MRELDPLLITVLAGMDAAWLPLRDADRNPHVFIAQKQFKQHGIAWRPGSTSEIGRKRSQRAIEQLAQAGELIVHRPRSTKNLCLRLPDATENRIRMLCGAGSSFGGYVSMVELAKLQKRDALYFEDWWISEERLAQHEYDGTAEASVQYATVQTLIMWAIVRELVVAVSTIQGHVRYSITPSGFKKLDSGWAEPDTSDEENSSFDTKAQAIYDRALRSASRRIDEIEPHGEIGPTFLPVAYGGLRFDAWQAAMNNRAAKVKGASNA